MRSLVEEASSITKAIENAWNNAGKPHEFKVKILEFPEFGFLGMVKKRAKISFFFEQASTSTTRQQQAPPRSIQEKQETPRRFTAVQKGQQSVRPARERVERKTTQDAAEIAQEQWTTEMVDYIQEWLTESLKLLNIAHSAFSAQVTNTELTIGFQLPLDADRRKERLLLSSFTYIILETVRNRFRKRLRNLRLCLVSPNNSADQQ